MPPWAGGTGGLPTGTAESLTVRIAFTATSGSTTSANGVLQAVGTTGTDHGSLDIHTAGLTSGTYAVSAESTSGTTPVTLGTFDVRAPRTSGSSPDGPPPGPRTNTRFGGPHGIAFPDGLDPFDIASLAISDSNGNVLFTADLTTIDDGAYFATTPVVSGTSVTGVTGVASIHACARAGVVTGVLKISASGLPDSIACTYDVNGTQVGTVSTGSGGSLKLVATENPTTGTLPSTVDLFTVTSVAVYDSDGNLLLSASF